MSKSSFGALYTHELSERLRELQESYVKRLPYMYIVVLFVFPFLFLLSLYSISMFWLIGVAYLVVMFFHILSVGESARKLVYAENLLRLERWRLYFFIFSVSSTIMYSATLGWLSYLGFRITQLPVPFDKITALFLAWFLFLIVTMLPLNLRGHQTRYRMAKLCFRVTIDEFEIILKQGKMPIKDAHRRFRWLKLGFQSCNDLLIREPYYVMVKNIDRCHQRIFSFALVGDKDDLHKFSVALQKVLASFGNKLSDFDLPSLLMALQLILGKEAKEKESTQELAEMILVKPSSWERTKAAIKSPYTVSVATIITLVVAILAIVFQFLHWGT